MHMHSRWPSAFPGGGEFVSVLSKGLLNRSLVRSRGMTPLTIEYKISNHLDF